jgi:acetate CoA/acetoacetate CoA-transferase beta subunit
MEAKTIIASRVAQELKEGYVVNLGIGTPTLVPDYLAPGLHITLQSENGFLGMGPLEGEPQPNLVNAGGQYCGLQPGAAIFDSAFSFALIRGGHVDLTVLGGLEVDQEGNLANWMVPGKMVPGMGGAMDLVTGARQVIVAMEHTTRAGAAKILTKCTLPLTACHCVDLIVTELAVFRCDATGLTLQELAPGITLDEVRKKTEASFMLDPELKTMQLNHQGLQHV